MSAKLLYGQVQLSAMNWPFYVAQERHLFAEEDLVVEAKIFNSGPEPVAQLINGSLEVISVIPDITLMEIEKGASLSLIANMNTRPQYRLVVQPPIKKFGDLKGKKIGVNDGRSAESLILRKLLRGKRLPADSYELTASGPPPQRCEKLEQGQLAATMVTQPFDLALEAEGFRVLASSREVVPRYPFTLAIVRKGDSINEKVLSFLNCLKKAWEWLADPANRDEASIILSHSTHTSQEQAQGTYDLYLQPPSAPSLTPSPEGVATILELLVESGRLPSPAPPAQKYIDERYFRRLEEGR